MTTLRKLAFVLALFLFICIRTIHLPQTIHFGSDEGRDFLTTWNMYTHRQLTLIGPPSQYTIYGRQFYFGPAPYYFILPALVIGHWEPLVVSYFLIFLNAVCLLISLLILSKPVKNKFVLYLFAIFCIFTPVFIKYSQSYWNPYFMLPISTVLVGLLVKSKDKIKQNTLFYLLIGFLFGLGLQFHYSFIFAIIVCIFWLVINKRLTKFSHILSLFCGFVIGFAPIILFEIRNHFYNLNTLLLVLTKSRGTHSGIGLNFYYLISLMPFFFLLIAFLLGKLSKDYRNVLYVIMTMYIAWSLWVIIPIKNYVFPYLELQSTEKLIQQDNPTQFNIVDQLTGDNRAMALRYLLTYHGIAPLGVTEYPSAKELYIYSDKPFAQLIINPVWEIKSFLPFKRVTTWQLSKRIFIYKLEK